MKELSIYEFLGNSLYKFNENMNELNIRLDNLYSDKKKWNDFFSIMTTLSSSIADFSTNISSVSGNWKAATNLVYNVKGFWEEPIQIVFNRTFNMIGNYLEIENFLNENFDPENFSNTQLIKCDFLCKNYNPDKFQQYPYVAEKRSVLEVYAKQYSIQVYEVYAYLSFLNQIKSLTYIINSLFTKNSRADLAVTDWRDLEQYISYVGYNYQTNTFVSTELEFSDIDLKFFYSYVLQYILLKNKLQTYINKKIDTIPDFILNQFTNKSIEVFLGGSFYFKKLNNKWTLFPYYGNEYCAGNYCYDCYDLLDINKLYTYEKPCFNSFEYILEECYE